jgi:hypothetical protein
MWQQDPHDDIPGLLEARAQHLQGAVKWREMARDGDAGRAATGFEIENEHARLAQVVHGCCAPRVSGPRLPVSAVLPQAPPVAVN